MDPFGGNLPVAKRCQENESSSLVTFYSLDPASVIPALADRSGQVFDAGVRIRMLKSPVCRDCKTGGNRSEFVAGLRRDLARRGDSGVCDSWSARPRDFRLRVSSWEVRQIGFRTGSRALLLAAIKENKVGLLLQDSKPEGNEDVLTGGGFVHNPSAFFC
jgi:hypothetical protein